jgi:hypothetical protein
MSHAHESPALDRFLESVVRRLPRDAVEAMADLRPPFDAPPGDALADELIHLFQAKARAAIGDESKAGPLPDDFQFNEETWEARRELEAGGGIRYANWDDLFADLGM